jgi:hypothetical protein
MRVPAKKADKGSSPGKFRKSSASDTNYLREQEKTMTYIENEGAVFRSHPGLRWSGLLQGRARHGHPA